jgi:hypothetical protein
MVVKRRVELTWENGWTRLQNLSTMYSLYQPIRVWSAHAADTETLFVRTRGRWHCTFASLVFMPGYEVLTHHSESVCQTTSVVEEDDDRRDDDRIDEMFDAIRPEFETNHENPPTPEVQKFFNILRASEELLHEHMTVSVIDFMTRLMAIKSKFIFSNNYYKKLLNLISDILPNNHKMQRDMY